ncbi:hypothetical protein SK128_003755 [Halocaridina rubra]|uniref:Uncharacterized protein n=1 Tax=Halocaridina rubra TaxID=373956 RepID=A0AAN8X2I8_HALRR
MSLLDRADVLDAIPNVEVQLMEWQKAHEALSEAGANLQDGHNLMALLKEAEANQQHSLYGLHPRYEEYSVVKKAVDHAKESVNSRLMEVKHWHNLYLVRKICLYFVTMILTSSRQ